MPSAQRLPSRTSRSIQAPPPRSLEVCGLSESTLVAQLLAISEVEAASLLRALGGLHGLVGASPAELRAQGVREASLAALLAAVELGVRRARGEIPRGRPLADRAATVRYLWLRYSVPAQEVFGALFLDSRGGLLGEEEFFRGTLTQVAVVPAPVLRAAIAVGASKILLFHTHPSGDPKPSGPDLLATRRFCEAAELVGLRLVDHLVLAGPEEWASVLEVMGMQSC